MKMICGNCGKNEATRHFEININGQRRVLDLCGKCAAEVMASGNIGGFTLNPFESGIFDVLRRSGMQERAPERCECCGATLSEIRKIGRVGCGKCYETFKGQLRPHIDNIHHGGKHRGKLPHGADADIRMKRHAEDLRRRLKEAIEAEDFESAAAIRDELRNISGGGKNE